MLDIIKVHPEIKEFIKFCEKQDSRLSNVYLEALAELYAKEHPGGYINSLFRSFNYLDIIDHAGETYCWEIADHWDVVEAIAEEIGDTDADQGFDNYRINHCIEEVYKRSSIEVRALAAPGCDHELVNGLQNEVKLVVTGTLGLDCSLEDMEIAVDHSICFLLDDKEWREPSFFNTLHGWLSLTSNNEDYSSIFYSVGGGWGQGCSTTEWGLMRLGQQMQGNIGKQVRITVITPVKATLKNEAIQRLTATQGDT